MILMMSVCVISLVISSVGSTLMGSRRVVRVVR